MGSPFSIGKPARKTRGALLLHGLPSLSRMFEPLFARLSDRYRLVAPDYPGFGHSDWPDPKQFIYTFDHYAEIMNRFTEGWRISHYTLYMQDYGGPVGFRMPWLTPTESRRSSSRTLLPTTKAWERIGKLGETFGQIALQTRARLRSNFFRLRQHEPAMSEAIRMWHVTTLISGPTSSNFLS